MSKEENCTVKELKKMFPNEPVIKCICETMDIVDIKVWNGSKNIIVEADFVNPINLNRIKFTFTSNPS